MIAVALYNGLNSGVTQFVEAREIARAPQRGVAAQRVPARTNAVKRGNLSNVQPSKRQ